MPNCILNAIQDHDSLKVSLESSERIRRQQKELIQMLQKAQSTAGASAHLTGGMSAPTLSDLDLLRGPTGSPHRSYRSNRASSVGTTQSPVSAGRAGLGPLPGPGPGPSLGGRRTARSAPLQLRPPRPESAPPRQYSSDGPGLLPASPSAQREGHARRRSLSAPSSPRHRPAYDPASHRLATNNHTSRFDQHLVSSLGCLGIGIGGMAGSMSSLVETRARAASFSSFDAILGQASPPSDTGTAAVQRSSALGQVDSKFVMDQARNREFLSQSDYQQVLSGDNKTSGGKVRAGSRSPLRSALTNTASAPRPTTRVKRSVSAPPLPVPALAPAPAVSTGMRAPTLSPAGRQGGTTTARTTSGKGSHKSNNAVVAAAVKSKSIAPKTGGVGGKTLSALSSSSSNSSGAYALVSVTVNGHGHPHGHANGSGSVSGNGKTVSALPRTSPSSASSVTKRAPGKSKSKDPTVPDHLKTTHSTPTPTGAPGSSSRSSGSSSTGSGSGSGTAGAGVSPAGRTRGYLQAKLPTPTRGGSTSQGSYEYASSPTAVTATAPAAAETPPAVATTDYDHDGSVAESLLSVPLPLGACPDHGLQLRPPTDGGERWVGEVMEAVTEAGVEARAGSATRVSTGEGKAAVKSATRRTSSGAKGTKKSPECGNSPAAKHAASTPTSTPTSLTKSRAPASASAGGGGSGTVTAATAAKRSALPSNSTISCTYTKKKAT